MSPKLILSLAALFTTINATAMTLNDYVHFADGSAQYNPPTCAVPYDSLDLSRITAWSGIRSDTDPNCGSCAQVCGGAGCAYLLVVDQCAGTDKLDISTVAGPGVVGSDTGNWEVSLEFVDLAKCVGIWDGRMFWDWQAPNANFQALKQLQGQARRRDGVVGNATAAISGTAAVPLPTKTPDAFSGAAGKTSVTAYGLALSVFAAGAAVFA